MKILDDSQMSLMYIKKSRGPRTDPWGTQHKVTSFVDTQFSIEVVCERPLRYEENQPYWKVGGLRRIYSALRLAVLR